MEYTSLEGLIELGHRALEVQMHGGEGNRI